MPKHIRIVVSKDRFRRNVELAKELSSPQMLCVVLKGNAYGHGVRALAPVAAEAGADFLGVCSNEEAIAIRDGGVSLRILRLRMALRDEIVEGVDLGIEEQVGTVESVRRIREIANEIQKTIPVHVNLDLGMGRSGFFPEQCDEVAGIVRSCEHLKISGIMTHFPNADGKTLEPTEAHLEAFVSFVDRLAPVLSPECVVHAFNSAAMVRWRSSAPMQAAVQKLQSYGFPMMTRAGALCFGSRASLLAFELPREFKPCMRVSTRIAELREVPAGRTIGYGSLFVTPTQMLIAALPIGFGDGYLRGLANKGKVLVHGQRCSVVGRVSLNIVTVDVTALRGKARVGDEVVLFGAQGDEQVTFEEMAHACDSVHTEIHVDMGALSSPIEYV